MTTEGGTATSPDQRVLAVDDEEEVRRLISVILGREGYKVTSAENGSVALEHLEREPFDLVITDLNMPEMDGLALLEECRTQYPQTDVMVLTAYGTIQSAVYAMKRGAIDYVTKPFGVGELQQTVASSFERRGTKAALPETYPVKPLVELNRILSSQMDLSDALDNIINLAQRTFAATASEVAVFDESLENGAILAASGERPASSSHLRRPASRPNWSPWWTRSTTW